MLPAEAPRKILSFFIPHSPTWLTDNIRSSPHVSLLANSLLTNEQSIDSTCNALLVQFFEDKFKVATRHLALMDAVESLQSIKDCTVCKPFTLVAIVNNVASCYNSGNVQDRALMQLYYVSFVKTFLTIASPQAWQEIMESKKPFPVCLKISCILYSMHCLRNYLY